MSKVPQPTDSDQPKFSLKSKKRKKVHASRSERDRRSRHLAPNYQSHDDRSVYQAPDTIYQLSDRLREKVDRIREKRNKERSLVRSDLVGNSFHHQTGGNANQENNFAPSATFPAVAEENDDFKKESLRTRTLTDVNTHNKQNYYKQLFQELIYCDDIYRSALLYILLLLIVATLGFGIYRLIVALHQEHRHRATGHVYRNKTFPVQRRHNVTWHHVKYPDHLTNRSTSSLANNNFTRLLKHVDLMTNKSTNIPTTVSTTRLTTTKTYANRRFKSTTKRTIFSPLPTQSQTTPYRWTLGTPSWNGIKWVWNIGNAEKRQDIPQNYPTSQTNSQQPPQLSDLFHSLHNTYNGQENDNFPGNDFPDWDQQNMGYQRNQLISQNQIPQWPQNFYDPIGRFPEGLYPTQPVVVGKEDVFPTLPVHDLDAVPVHDEFIDRQHSQVNSNEQKVINRTMTTVSTIPPTTVTTTSRKTTKAKKLSRKHSRHGKHINRHIHKKHHVHLDHRKHKMNRHLHKKRHHHAHHHKHKTIPTVRVTKATSTATLSTTQTTKETTLQSTPTTPATTVQTTAKLTLSTNATAAHPDIHSTLPTIRATTLLSTRSSLRYTTHPVSYLFPQKYYVDENGNVKVYLQENAYQSWYRDNTIHQAEKMNNKEKGSIFSNASRPEMDAENEGAQNNFDEELPETDSNDGQEGYARPIPFLPEPKTSDEDDYQSPHKHQFIEHHHSHKLHQRHQRKSQLKREHKSRKHSRHRKHGKHVMHQKHAKHHQHKQSLRHSKRNHLLTLHKRHHKATRKPVQSSEESSSGSGSGIEEGLDSSDERFPTKKIGKPKPTFLEMIRELKKHRHNKQNKKEKMTKPHHNSKHKHIHHKHVSKSNNKRSKKTQKPRKRRNLLSALHKRLRRLREQRKHTQKKGMTKHHSKSQEKHKKSFYGVNHRSKRNGVFNDDNFHGHRCVLIEKFPLGTVAYIRKTNKVKQKGTKYIVRLCKPQKKQHRRHFRCHDVVYTLSTGLAEIRKQKEKSRTLFAIYGCRNSNLAHKKSKTGNKKTRKVLNGIKVITNSSGLYADEESLDDIPEDDAAPAGDGGGEEYSADYSGDTNENSYTGTKKSKKISTKHTIGGESSKINDLMKMVQDMRNHLDRSTGSSKLKGHHHKSPKRSQSHHTKLPKTHHRPRHYLPSAKQSYDDYPADDESSAFNDEHFDQGYHKYDRSINTGNLKDHDDEDLPVSVDSGEYFGKQNYKQNRNSKMESLTDDINEEQPVSMDVDISEGQNERLAQKKHSAHRRRRHRSTDKPYADHEGIQSDDVSDSIGHTETHLHKKVNDKESQIGDLGVDMQDPRSNKEGRIADVMAQLLPAMMKHFKERKLPDDALERVPAERIELRRNSIFTPAPQDVLDTDNDHDFRPTVAPHSTHLRTVSIPRPTHQVTKRVQHTTTKQFHTPRKKRHTTRVPPTRHHTTPRMNHRTTNRRKNIPSGRSHTTHVMTKQPTPRPTTKPKHHTTRHHTSVHPNMNVIMKELRKLGIAPTSHPDNKMHTTKKISASPKHQNPKPTLAPMPQPPHIVKPHHPDSLRILCFGDSLTAGYNKHGKNFYPYGKRLQDILNYRSQIPIYTETRGVVGEMTHKQMTGRLPLVLGNATAPFDWVVILGGTNDILHVKNFADDQEFLNQLENVWQPRITKDIEKLHKIAYTYGTHTMLLTVPENSIEGWPDYKPLLKMRQRINEALRKFAAQSDGQTVLCDLARKLPRHTLGPAQEALYWDDHLHMTPEGYNKMAQIVADCLKPYLPHSQTW